MDELKRSSQDLVHIARLALEGKVNDVQMFLRRALRHYQVSEPEVARQLQELLAQRPARMSSLREVDPIPVDIDSRLDLIRFEHLPELDIEPVFTPDVQKALEQVILERQQPSRLLDAGLVPTKSLLLTGPPGVGKTLAAKWLARQLQLPLLTLDLSAVMSSFLGRTGTNVRYVLDYAKRQSCILLLDEFDAVAKRRDDATEIGELKRLVTVLLQEIDEWPATGLLIAATNHPTLLDPAVWRRFDLRLEFPMPTFEQMRGAISQWLSKGNLSSEPLAVMLSAALRNESLSEAGKTLIRAQRSAVLTGANVEERLHQLLAEKLRSASLADRKQVATILTESGLSQREVNSITGLSRDTIRKITKTK
ncbi:MAG TPA: ATP-binding protein [Chthoniobacterales bacterium]